MSIDEPHRRYSWALGILAALLASVAYFVSSLRTQTGLPRVDDLVFDD